MATTKIRFVINETQNTSNVVVSIAEIQVHESVGGADICTGGTASANSTLSEGLYGAGKAVDDDNGTAWVSNTAPTPWSWEYDFGASKSPVEYSFRIRTDVIDDSPVDWDVQTWNGSSWDTVVSNQTTPSDWTYGELRTFSLPTPPPSPANGTLTLTGQTPATSFVSPAAAGAVLTGQVPTAAIIMTVYPDAGSATLTGQAPTFDDPIDLRPAAGAMLFTGWAPSISFNRWMTGEGTLFALTGEATIKDVSAQGDGAFDQMTAAATTGAIGSGNLYALTGEAAAVKGKAASGAGALYALTGEATTGAEGVGTLFALIGEGEVVTGHLASGASSFAALTGEGSASVDRSAAGAGSFALIYGGASATKGHVGAGSASLYALRGESAAVKGHGLDGDADLYLMTGEAAGFGQADLDGDAGFYLMTGNGEAFMQGRFGDEYILYHRRPA